MYEKYELKKVAYPPGIYDNVLKLVFAMNVSFTYIDLSILNPKLNVERDNLPSRKNIVLICRHGTSSCSHPCTVNYICLSIISKCKSYRQLQHDSRPRRIPHTLLFQNHRICSCSVVAQVYCYVLPKK